MMDLVCTPRTVMGLCVSTIGMETPMPSLPNAMQAPWALVQQLDTLWQNGWQSRTCRRWLLPSILWWVPHCVMSSELLRVQQVTAHLFVAGSTA